MITVGPRGAMRTAETAVEVMICSLVEPPGVSVGSWESKPSPFACALVGVGKSVSSATHYRCTNKLG